MLVDSIAVSDVGLQCDHNEGACVADDEHGHVCGGMHTAAQPGHAGILSLRGSSGDCSGASLAISGRSDDVLRCAPSRRRRYPMLNGHTPTTDATDLMTDAMTDAMTAAMTAAMTDARAEAMATPKEQR